jgi:hypothetical protein
LAKFVKTPTFRRKFEEQAIAPLVDRLTDNLLDVFREAFDAIAYDWDRPTVRSNGQIVTSPRSNVDTGGLRDSAVKKKVSRLRYEIAWIKPYAVLSLLGGVRRSDGSETPPKDWIEVGLGMLQKP